VVAVDLPFLLILSCLDSKSVCDVVRRRLPHRSDQGVISEVHAACHSVELMFYSLSVHVPFSVIHLRHVLAHYVMAEATMSGTSSSDPLLPACLVSPVSPAVALSASRPGVCAQLRRFFR
jgi:hypothetical protein